MIARKASRIGKWVLVAFTGLPIRFLQMYFEQEIDQSFAIGQVPSLLRMLTVFFLFRPPPAGSPTP